MLSYLYIIAVYSLLIQIVVLLCFYFPKPRNTRRYQSSEKKFFISVIVAVRNEEKNLQTLISALVNQNYDNGLFEIIFIDDYSNDNSLKILNEAKEKYSNIKVLNNTYSQNKKNAIRTGIENSSGEIILLTDADCIPNPNWIKSISNVFYDEVDISIGYSPFVPQKGLLNQIARYENYLTSFLMTAFYNVGYPYMCFGRNLAYKKTLFDLVKGFDEIDKSMSGDDDLFLQKAIKKNAKVFLNQSKESVVHTKFNLSFNQFINQKTRHVSASKYYSTTLKIILGFYYVINFILTFLIIPAVIYYDLFLFTLWLVHLIIQILKIQSIAKILNERFNLIFIPVLEIIYSILLIIFGILSRKKIVRWR